MIAFFMLSVNSIRAVRPFITDDATLIGKKRAEIANWFYASKAGTEIWHSLNYGLNDWVEINVLGFWGRSRFENAEGKTIKEWSYTLPLLQTKFLIRDYEPNSWPGITVAVGTDIPWGKGPFVAEGNNVFAFTSATQCFGKHEELLFHAQIGATYLRNKKSKETLIGVVFGFGTQVKVYKGLHLIGEIVNGDPYEHGVGSLYQFGIRQFVNDDLQFDLAFGAGISGDIKASTWFTGGIRYVLSFNKDDRFAANGRRIN
ncbi:MAG: hypothetical protein FWE63_02870 [Bacteroidales bacterium]|nr:hypothetical protein [Bacteroidales bacterium]